MSERRGAESKLNFPTTTVKTAIIKPRTDLVSGSSFRLEGEIKRCCVTSAGPSIDGNQTVDLSAQINLGKMIFKCSASGIQPHNRVRSGGIAIPHGSPLGSIRLIGLQRGIGDVRDGEASRDGLAICKVVVCGCLGTGDGNCSRKQEGDE